MGMILLHDFFGPIREVFFDLIVCKFENLETISERGLSGLCLSKIVDNSLISVCLLDITVIEVDYGVAVWEDLTLHTIVEYYFFLSVFVHSLNLTIVSNNLLDNLHISGCLVVIMRREFHVKIFSLIFFLAINSTRLGVCRRCLVSADILLISVVFFDSHGCLVAYILLVEHVVVRSDS